MPLTPSHPLIAQLVALDTLKTWSLIATLFGDLNGQQLSGAQIRNVLGHIGTKPEAIRVALHRLKSEGWIVATKQGREAIYTMSPMALDETKTVRPDIYNQSSKYQNGWCFELFQENPSSSEAILLGKNLAICPVCERTQAPDVLPLTAQGAPLPKWVEAMIAPDNLVALAAALASIIPHFADLTDPKDKVLFRLLVLHHWRRIALRRGSWAHASLLPEGPIAVCHSWVTRFLEAEDKISVTF